MAGSQEPGRAEADFGRLDAKTVVRNVYILFSRSELPIAAENQEIMDLVDSSTPLPPWFTEEDLEAYGKLYEKSGFRTALRVPNRVIKEDLGIATDPTVKVPVLNIMGNKDYVFKFPGMADYISIGKLKECLSPIWRLYFSLKELILFKNNCLNRLMSSSSPSLESTFDHQT